MKTALIGCGRIGFILENDPLRYKPCTHYGGLISAGLNVHCACDINPERLMCFGKLAGINSSSLYSDYRELLVKEKPELVIIATWTGSHAEIGLRACAEGARVIICEKPIASNLALARKLVKSCETRGVHLIINHERRYDQRYRKVRDMISRGLVGDVRTVHASVLSSGYSGDSKPEEGGGPLMHDGTHLIDILRFFFGDISCVHGEFQRFSRDHGYEDRAVAWLKMNSGIDVFLEAGGKRKYFLFDLDISATEGRIVIGNGYQRLYKNVESRFYTGFQDLEERPFPKTGRKNCFTALYRETKNLLWKKSSEITSTGMDGYLALETIHAVYYSSETGKKVDLPLKPDKVDIRAIFGL